MCIKKNLEGLNIFSQVMYLSNSFIMICEEVKKKKVKKLS